MEILAFLYFSDWCGYVQSYHSDRACNYFLLHLGKLQNEISGYFPVCTMEEKDGVISELGDCGVTVCHITACGISREDSKPSSGLMSSRQSLFWEEFWPLLYRCLEQSSNGHWAVVLCIQSYFPCA